MVNQVPKGSVRAPSAAVTAMGENWPLVDALLGGTPAMRKAAKAYLPKWPNEGDEDYTARLASATLFPAFSHTVDVLVGKPFSKPLVQSDETPEQLVAWSEDIDLQGQNLHSFAAGIAHSALSYGFGGILVDYPQADGVRTVADEKSAGVRPYWVELKGTSILGWRSERLNGANLLTQLRFLETVTEADGEFGETIIEQVRVLYPGKWQVWREDKNADIASPDRWKLHVDGVTSLQKIPFVPVYGTRSGFMSGAPPLLELAFMNVQHWQSKSDQDTILHVARVPILFARNMGDCTLVVGASQAVQGNGENADLKFVEHTGKAIEAGRLSLLDSEDRMRQIGAELLVIKPGKTTVAQTMSDEAPGMCVLQSIIQNLEGSLDAAMALTAEWVATEYAGKVQIFDDYGVSTLGEATLKLLRDMNVDGTLSDETLFHEAQRRGELSADLDWEAEAERIKQNVPKGAAQVQIKDT